MPTTEQVDIHLPSGEIVTVEVPSGMKDEDIKGKLQQQHPELFAKANTPESLGMPNAAQQAHSVMTHKSLASSGTNPVSGDVTSLHHRGVDEKTGAREGTNASPERQKATTKLINTAAGVTGAVTTGAMLAAAPVPVAMSIAGSIAGSKAGGYGGGAIGKVIGHEQEGSQVGSTVGGLAGGLLGGIYGEEVLPPWLRSQLPAFLRDPASVSREAQEALGEFMNKEYTPTPKVPPAQTDLGEFMNKEYEPTPKVPPAETARAEFMNKGYENTPKVPPTEAARGEFMNKGYQNSDPLREAVEGGRALEMPNKIPARMSEGERIYRTTPWAGPEPKPVKPPPPDMTPSGGTLTSNMGPGPSPAAPIGQPITGPTNQAFSPVPAATRAGFSSVGKPVAEPDVIHAQEPIGSPIEPNLAGSTPRDQLEVMAARGDANAIKQLQALGRPIVIQPRPTIGRR